MTNSALYALDSCLTREENQNFLNDMASKHNIYAFGYYNQNGTTYKLSSSKVKSVWHDLYPEDEANKLENKANKISAISRHIKRIGLNKSISFFESNKQIIEDIQKKGYQSFKELSDEVIDKMYHKIYKD